MLIIYKFSDLQESQDQITQSLNKSVVNNGMPQMEMSSNLNMVTSTNTSIQGHQMMQQQQQPQQQMQSPLISHSPMGTLQSKPLVQQLNRQQSQQMQIGQPAVMMPHQQSTQMNQMQQQTQPQQLQQQQQSTQPMGYQNYYANFGNR